MAYYKDDPLEIIKAEAREEVWPPLAPNYVVPGRTEQEQMAARALQYLGLALTCARNAKAPRTTQRIEKAISSAKGAVRAAGYRAMRQAEQVQP